MTSVCRKSFNRNTLGEEGPHPPLQMTPCFPTGWAHAAHLPCHRELGDLPARHALCQVRNLRALLPVVKLSQLQAPGKEQCPRDAPGASGTQGDWGSRVAPWLLRERKAGYLPGAGACTGNPYICSWYRSFLPCRAPPFLLEPGWGPWRGRVWTAVHDALQRQLRAGPDVPKWRGSWRSQRHQHPWARGPRPSHSDLPQCPDRRHSSSHPVRHRKHVGNQREKSQHFQSRAAYHPSRSCVDPFPVRSG